MINCPFCGVENTESDEFCVECGRLLKKTEKKTKTAKKYLDSDSEITYFSNVQIIVRDGMEGYLWFPDTQSYKEGGWELSFRANIGVSLADFLAEEPNRTVSKYIEIEKRIFSIFEKAQEQGYIVGSCDLEDFYLEHGDIDRMLLRVVRPLVLEGRLPKDYNTGEFSAPEIKNNNAEYIGSRTDVYLAAIIFNRLLIGSKYSVGNIDAQLFWGYTLTNAAFWAEGKRIRRFHQWLGDTLNMYPTKRKRDVKNARMAFEKSCELEECKINENINIEDYLKTDVGKGKKAFMENAGRDENEWNEDSIEKWEKSIAGKPARAYLLADGISNCDVGSGFYASNIVRENFKNTLDELVDDTFEDVTIDAVENLAYEIVKRSNNDIWRKASEYPSQSGSIMGSTFIFIFIIYGRMYTYCLGDSPLYLIRRGRAIPLYSPDNVGTEALRNGMSYIDYRQLEGRECISLYIGGEYARTRSDYYTKRQIDVMTLQEDDLIIAMSDGVLDYMGTKLSETSWDKETVLVKKATNKEPLQSRAMHIIAKDNNNGGGDNLSIILIKAGGNSNE